MYSPLGREIKRNKQSSNQPPTYLPELPFIILSRISSTPHSTPVWPHTHTLTFRSVGCIEDVIHIVGQLWPTGVQLQTLNMGGDGEGVRIKGHKASVLGAEQRKSEKESDKIEWSKMTQDEY